MSQNTECTEKSDYHLEKKTTLTLQRVIDDLKTKLQEEPFETEATKLFKEDIDFIEKEYNGIQEIVEAYEKAYKNFNGAMKSKAQQQWDSIVSWPDGKVTKEVEDAITKLREGEFYAEKEKTLKEKLKNAEEAFYSLKECYEFFAAKEIRAIEKFEKSKVYEKTVGNYFSELQKLFEEAKAYKDAGKYRSVFAVQLEFNDIRKKTLTPKDSGSLADPKKFKKNLTNELQKVIALKDERYLWHKKFLLEQDTSQKELLSKQTTFEKAMKNYEDHIKNIRDRLIREAEDIQPAVAKTDPPPSKDKITAESTTSPTSEPHRTSSKK